MGKCYSFEPSGHKMRPLDGANGIVLRLYCPRCSRVVSTYEAQHNTAGWDFESLPTESKVDYLSNGAVVIRKEN